MDHVKGMHHYFCPIREEIHHLHGQVFELKQVNSAIPDTSKEHMDKIMEKILGKSNEDLGLELIGK